MNNLLPLKDTIRLIENGYRLILSGDESILKELPRGNWIGGTSPYFMTKNGYFMTRDLISVVVLPPAITMVTTQFYDADALRGIAADGSEHGFTVLILPRSSSLLQEFSKNVASYPGIFNRPLIGWVSGVAMHERTTTQAKVVDGVTGEWSADRGIALHATLKPQVVAEVGIVNPFRQGDGDSITVDLAGFVFRQVRINGRLTDLAAYLRETQTDVRLPLVANYTGALVNVSIRSVDHDSGEVTFFGPLFPHVEYKLAAPAQDYKQVLDSKLKQIQPPPLLMVSCVLNSVYAEATSVCDGHILGPISFGEIAYGLLNQTAVYMVLHGGDGGGESDEQLQPVDVPDHQ